MRRRCLFVPLLALIVGLVVFVVLAAVCRRFELILLRELFAAAERLGFISSTDHTYWGQIAGKNIPKHPDWLRACFTFLAAFIAYAPAFLCSLAAVRWIVRPLGSATRCGGCARPLKNLAEPSCPHCGQPL